MKKPKEEFSSLTDVASYFVFPQREGNLIHETIYHYTSPEGLMGIVQEEKIVLHFSRFDCVNDVSEGKKFTEIYKSMCVELKDKKAINIKFFNQIKDISASETMPFLLEHKNSKGDPKTPLLGSTEYDAYLCCFSTEENSLPMWNYYSKSGGYQGYNLGFDVRSIRMALAKHEEGMESPQCGVCFKLEEVIYSDDENIRKKIKDFITRLYEFKEDANERTIKQYIQTYLQNKQLIVKDSCFSYENEIRIILYVSKKDVNDKYSLRFKSAHGYVIPYIEIQLDHREYGVRPFLEKVTIGPLRERAFAEAAIKSLLNSRGHCPKITQSKAPIRF